MMRGASNVYQFRRAAAIAPPLSPVLADTERRGCPTAPAAPFTLSPEHSGFAVPIVLAPCDSENHEQTPGFFHTGKGGDEGFVCSSPLDGARGIGRWVGIFLAFDAALIAAGMWVFG